MSHLSQMHLSEGITSLEELGVTQIFDISFDDGKRGGTLHKYGISQYKVVQSN